MFDVKSGRFDDAGVGVVRIRMENVSMGGGVKILSVSELTSQVKGMLEEEFASLWISGEVTAFKRHQSGHWYFTLKDAGAVLPAVMWRSSNARVKIELKEGMEVLARGALSVYVPHGKYQFNVLEIQAKGLGALEVALRQLKEKLAAKGYFRPERKRPLPRHPSRVALVTSPSGAAVRDMLEILGRRWPATEVYICPVRVQGDTAAAEIANAMALLNRVGGVDVIILGRGGGSTDDLHAFNDERVADSVFRSRVPVVAAIGHEIDVTIADLVADKRALTPSEAAELVVPDRVELLKKVGDMDLRLRELLWGRLESARGRLADFGDRRIFRRPLDRIHDLEQGLDEIGERLQRCMRQRLDRWRQMVQATAGQLETLSPLNVLSRGYSLTRRASDQQVVRTADQVKPGDLLVTVLLHGQITSRVE
jgi:exodeoxyribonuclease VII large subunit